MMMASLFGIIVGRRGHNYRIENRAMRQPGNIGKHPSDSVFISFVYFTVVLQGIQFLVSEDIKGLQVTVEIAAGTMKRLYVFSQSETYQLLNPQRWPYFDEQRLAVECMTIQMVVWMKIWMMLW
jgi:hypothetical protein